MEALFDLSKTSVLVQVEKRRKLLTPFHYDELRDASLALQYALSIPDQYIHCAVLHLDPTLLKGDGPHVAALLYVLRSKLERKAPLVVEPVTKRARRLVRTLGFRFGGSIGAQAEIWGMQNPEELSAQSWEKFCKKILPKTKDQPRIFEFFPQDDWSFSLKALRAGYHPTVVLFASQKRAKKKLLEALKGLIPKHE